MNQELQIFTNPQFGQVRTLEEAGNVLFCGADVATALGYTNPRKALDDHCKGVTAPFAGRVPSVEEFIAWCVDRVNHRCN